MKQEVKEEVSEQDMELFKEQWVKDLANAEKEFERGAKNLTSHEVALEMLKEQLGIFSVTKDIIIKGYVPVEPQWEYEKDPDYMVQAKRLKDLELRQEIMKLEDALESMKATIDAKVENLGNLSNKIEKLRDDLDE